MKFSLYRNFPIAACILGLGLVGLVLRCLEINVSFDSTNPDASATKVMEIPISHTTSSPIPPAPGDHLDKSNYLHFFSDRFKQSHSQEQQRAILRMSNQTDEPIRLAFLARQPTKNNSAHKKITSKPEYDIPAHWDFAPQEGSSKGLILSLPQGNLHLAKGDILVAFAQDGSGRYWGPYVVGETSLPTWNSQNQEWQLVLTPEKR